MGLFIGYKENGSVVKIALGTVFTELHFLHNLSVGQIS
jgi:hypothetical protein